MNWLAHLLLSEPTPEFRLGNLLPDMMAPSQLRGLPADILRGVECHRRIDAFTDRHETVRRSVARISPAHRRFGGILVDVFYDHFLTVDWAEHSTVPLLEFADEAYRGFESAAPFVSAPAWERLSGMCETNLLCSYGTILGVEHALMRIGTRFRNPIRLELAVVELEENHDALHRDFREFFPDLREHIEGESLPFNAESQRARRTAEGKG